MGLNDSKPKDNKYFHDIYCEILQLTLAIFIDLACYKLISLNLTNEWHNWNKMIIKKDGI